MSQLIKAFSAQGPDRRHGCLTIRMRTLDGYTGTRCQYQTFPWFFKFGCSFCSHSTALFCALWDINAWGMIHRDVKLARFLFDPHRGVGTLVDFVRE